MLNNYYFRYMELYAGNENEFIDGVDVLNSNLILIAIGKVLMITYCLTNNSYINCLMNVVDRYIAY